MAKTNKNQEKAVKVEKAVNTTPTEPTKDKVIINPIKTDPTPKVSNDIIVIGLVEGGLIEGKEYKLPQSAANKLVSIGHAKLK